MEIERKYYGIRFNDDIPSYKEVNEYHKNVEIKFIGTAYLLTEDEDGNIVKTELECFHKFKENGEYYIQFINSRNEMYEMELKIKKRLLIPFLLFGFILLCLILLFIPKYSGNTNTFSYWKTSILSIIGLEKENIYDFNVAFLDGDSTSKNVTKSSKAIKLIDTLDVKTAMYNKICPGSSGSFGINISSQKSNVDMNYIVHFIDVTDDKPKNILFNIKGDNKKYSSLQQLEKYLTGKINCNSSKKIIIEWSWAYEIGYNDNVVDINDLIDTNDGENLTSYKFIIEVKGSEVIQN